jgi:hypothetical protein
LQFKESPLDRTNPKRAVIVAGANKGMIAVAFLIVLGFYLLMGILFAVPFVLFGVKEIDPHAVSASRGFRLLLVPGAISL